MRASPSLRSSSAALPPHCTGRCGWENKGGESRREPLGAARPQTLHSGRVWGRSGPQSRTIESHRPPPPPEWKGQWGASGRGKVTGPNRGCGQPRREEEAWEESKVR